MTIYERMIIEYNDYIYTTIYEIYSRISLVIYIYIIVYLIFYDYKYIIVVTIFILVITFMQVHITIDEQFSGDLKT